MKFELEPDVALKASPASETSRKIYRGKLNSIAKAELASNRVELKKAHKAVIKYIDEMYSDDEGGRQKKRVIVYAIFYAMDVKYLKKPNDYYTYLQTINPLKHSVTGADWIPLAEYKIIESKEKLF